ncbi:hypothetical protein C2E23DRAFT_741042 [Lenzites betulinus]|nr:hypothetical protein C2E23DRAFT_741042 [Lenzites betulinus]
MASTSTTETRSRDKRDTVPLLLESFPVPPSFIPPSPLLSPSPSSPLPPTYSPFVSPLPSPATKQPLSAPPSAPLPPIPGPSPITEHETLMFISAARSRRSSKMSLASTSSRYSRRDSLATEVSNASGSSMPSLSPSTSVTPNDSSRSLRSYPSSGSLSVPLPRYNIDKSPVIQPRIAEEDAADLTRMSLDEISLHSPLPEHLSDDERVLEVGIAPSISRQTRHQPHRSLSSIEAREGHSAPDEFPAVPSGTPRPRHPTSPLDKELPPLPFPQPPPRSSLPPPPSGPSRSHSRRTSSPDIDEIIATTPRPQRKSSAGSGLRSRSTSRSVRGLRKRASEGVNVSEAGSRRTSAASTSRRTSLARVRSRPESASELAYEQTAMATEEGDVWDEDSFVSDYGVPIDQTGTPYEMFDVNEEARLDRELDGDGSDSDSSLDLHTPLPHLMVKDGLLSPRSKLVQTSRNNTPLPGDRPSSVFSVASSVGSVMTKSGLFKDERDTVQRRVRHRDGRLLAGGIGLTTGLGWSDSEDEDAPSPLIRRISSRNLKKRAISTTSLRSQANSLSHSYSGHMPDSRLDEFGVLPKVPRSSAPPTSWQKPRSLPGRGNDWRISTASSVSSASSASALSHAPSRGSVVSQRSAPAGLSSSRRGLETTPLSMHALGNIREGDEIGSNTPSTSSTASLPMPATPDDLPIRSRSGSLGGKKLPARLDLAGTPEYSHSDVIALNSGSLSSAPNTATIAPSPALSSFSSASTPRQGVPRPLRLPQSAGNLRRATDPPLSRMPLSASASTSAAVQRASSGSLRQKPSLQSLRPPSAARAGTSHAGAMSAPPQDGASFPFGGPSMSPSKSTPASRSSTPSSAAGVPRLKPRTGTGMVYRTTGNSSSAGSPAGTRVAAVAAEKAVPVRPSMLRMPSTTSLRSAKGVGIAM